jgi:trehalose synthase
VAVGRQSVESYRRVAPPEIVDALQEVGASLRGVRVLHLNATPYGGGVSELLRSAIPLLEDLGLVPEWRVVSGDETFFRITKRIHNALQGAPDELSESEWETYLQTSRRNAGLLGDDYDVVVVHDPQPAAVLAARGRGRARWIWRCHIDTSDPNPAVWESLRTHLAEYDAAVFTMRSFVPPGLPVERVELMPPAIDPLSPKNLPIPQATAREVLDWIGIDPGRPLVSQISRFDPWKDPLGVVAAHRLVRNEIPDVQLALAGSMALDDPEGWEVYQVLQETAAGDPLIHVFTNLTGVGNIEVNAFQRLSDVIVQKSVREGFGLVVSEALWKGTPVVAGRAGGIPLQMADGAGGSLVETIDETASAILALLRDRDSADTLGAAGRHRVREHFLLPRLLLSELLLISELLGRPVERPLPRDPICGLVLTSKSARRRGLEGSAVFCSSDCRLRFEAAAGADSRARDDSVHGHGSARGR